MTDGFWDEPGGTGWPEGMDEVWSSLPGSSYYEDIGLESEEYQEAASLLYAGWFDPDATPDERHEMRELFFEWSGIPEELFPWSDWREAMGYE